MPRLSVVPKVAFGVVLLAGCGRDAFVAPLSLRNSGEAGDLGRAAASSAPEVKITLGETHTLQFSAALLRSRTTDWYSADPSIASVNGSGLVRGNRVGTTTITATNAGVSQQYSVVVYSAPPTSNPGDQSGNKPTVTGLVLSPKSGVALPFAGSRQFSATFAWSDGTNTAAQVQYSATGGSISTGGLYTAGSVAGTFMVVANCLCGFADTAVVQVVNNAPQLTKLTISPKNVTLAAGATQQFTVTANWSTGATDVPPVRWSSTAGSISNGGLYLAPSLAGKNWVIVQHDGGKIADSALVTVSGAAGPTDSTGQGKPFLTSFRVVPRRAYLSLGGQHLLSAVAKWSDGTDRLPARAYKALDGGSITPSGRFIAPSQYGVYRVEVRPTNITPASSLADTAEFIVEQPDSPPTAGRVLFTDSFESGDFSRSQNGISWGAASWVSVTTVVSHGAGSHSAVFRQGDSREWAELRFGGLPQLPEVFIQYFLYQPRGDETPSLGPRVRVIAENRNDKFFRLWSGDYGSADLKFGASTWGQNGIGMLGSEFGAGSGVAGQGGVFEQLDKFPLIGDPRFLGKWTKIQIRARVASARNDDGLLQVWIDGELAINQKTLPVFPTSGSNNFIESGYLMGWAASGFQAGQRIYIDDVVFSTGGFELHPI